LQESRGGGSCDDVYYDGGRRRIYALAGEGFISVVQQNDPDAVRKYPLCSGRAHWHLRLRAGFGIGTRANRELGSAGIECQKAKAPAADEVRDDRFGPMSRRAA